MSKYFEFEGKNEDEAIQKATETLGLSEEGFDIEILESESGSFFKKGRIKIRVHVKPEKGMTNQEAVSAPRMRIQEDEGEVVSDEYSWENSLAIFLEEIIRKMDISATITTRERYTDKIVLDISSEETGWIIGKQGKNLDALQLLVNSYLKKLLDERQTEYKVILDVADYRQRQEEKIEQIAHRTASLVKKSRRSRLLEPMNPFERRIVHTSLDDDNDIATMSEGEGYMRQVRVIYRGSTN